MQQESQVRLQKYLSRCGIASRRSCETLIVDGRVMVNDVVVTKLGSKINPETDIVALDGNEVKPLQNDITIMLNKPAGYVSTMNDPQGRPCVADLIPVDEYPNMFPVGRLDRLTCGMLIFTTDGQLGQNLLHPKNEVEKSYWAVVVGTLQTGSAEIGKLENGIDIGDFVTSPARVDVIEHFDFSTYQKYETEFFENCAAECSNDELPNTKDLIDKQFSLVNITIHEGKNRQVRRMFEAVGHHVLLLKRVSIGDLTLGDVECGKWTSIGPSQISLMGIK